MIRAVRRTPLGVATASRRSVWWQLPALQTQRWLTTPSATVEDPDQHVRAASATKHKEKNARQFALLPSFVDAYKASMGHDVVPKQFAVPPAEDSDTYRFRPMPTRMVGRESDVQAIPWPADLLGLNLGRVLRQFATNKKHQAEHPEVTAALVSIEFPLNDAYHKQRWEKQTLAALKTFHRVHGHMNVPAGFIVPRGDGEWPVAAWGYRLGARVERLRHEAYELDASQLADLDSVQLPPCEGKSTWIDTRKDLREGRRRGNEVAVKLGESHKEKPQALFKEKLDVTHEKLEVPRKKPMPRESPWGFKVSHKENSTGSSKKKPTELPNEKLNVQHKQKADVTLEEKLEAPRTKPWDFDDRERCADHDVDTDNQWSQFVLPSLEVFFQAKGHSLVARNFIVPSVSPWPMNAWGLKLGACVVRMRSRGDYSIQSKRDATRLIAIGFAWDLSEYNWNQRIFPALKVFTEKHGHCDVPRSFVVPSHSPWPRKSWGFALGHCMDEILTRECFFDQTERNAAQLEAIGIARKPSEYRWSHVVLPALETFFSTFRHCDVSNTFVVPSRSPWPEESWGLQLGFCVTSIWSSGAFADHIERDAARLQAIDFVERSTDYNWDNIVLPALRTFADMYGHCRVPRTFIVPFKAPWPEKAWGWRLGGATRSIRTAGKYTAQVERDANELKAIGFNWGETKDVGSSRPRRRGEMRR